MTVANLGIAIDSSAAPRAVADLDKLVPASARVEKAANDMAASVTIAAKRTGSATADMAQKLLQAANDAENMAARINRSMQIGMRADPSSRGRDIAEYGRQLDALRAKFNPLYAEITRYKAMQGDIRQAHLVGAISTNEMTDALSRHRAETLANIAAIKGRNAALSDTPVNRGASSFNTSNLASQGFDVVTTAGFMPWYTVALQQGPQVAHVFNDIKATGSSIGPAVSAAFMQLVNPVSLLTIGAIAASAALIQWAAKGIEGAKTLDEAFKAHEATLERIDGRYAGFTNRLSGYQENTNLLLVQARADLASMEATARAANTDLMGKLITDRSYDYRTDKVVSRVDTQFQPFLDAIEALNRSIEAGRPNLAQFYADIERRVSIDPALREPADIILKTGENALKAQAGVDGHRQTVELLGEATRNNLSDLTAFRDVLGDLGRLAVPALSDMEQAAEAYRKGIEAARTPGERSSIDSAFIDARTRIQNQIDGSQVPIPTTRPNDIEIWDERTEAAEKAAKEAEKLAKEREREEQQRARARQPYENLISGQRDQLELLRAEAALLGQSEQAREQVIASLQLEQQIRRLNIPLYGSEAQALRANAAEIIQLTQDREQAMNRMAEVERDWSENRDIAKGFMTDLTDGLRDGTSLWKSFADAALNALNRITDKLLDRAFEGILDAFMPKPGGSSGSGGFTPTIGGFASMIFGSGGQNSGGANDNYAPGAVTRAPLAAGGDAQSQVWNFFANKGLAPHQVAGVMGHVGQESAFNPSAVGDAGKAFGLFQHHAARGGGQGLLGKGLNGQLEHAWSELQSTEKGTLNRLMASTDVRSATAAFGGFERPSGYSAANPEGMHGWSNRLNGAQEALKKFGTSVETSTASATGALDQLTTGSVNATEGVSQFGSTLANAFPAAPSAPGGGGLGGILGKLFGGGGATMASMSAISPLAASHIAGGGFGLFADGGYTGPGGIDDPAGLVHRGEVVWSQKDIAGAGGVGAVERMRKSGGRAGSGSSSMTYAPVSHITIGDNAGVSKADVEAIVQDNNKRQAEAFEKKQANAWRFNQ